MFKLNLQIGTQQFLCIFFQGGGAINTKVKFKDYKLKRSVTHCKNNRWTSKHNKTESLKIKIAKQDEKHKKTPKGKLKLMCFYCF